MNLDLGDIAQNTRNAHDLHEYQEAKANEGRFQAVSTEAAQLASLARDDLHALEHTSGDAAPKVARQLQGDLTTLSSLLALAKQAAHTSEDHEYLGFLHGQLVALLKDSEEPIAKANSHVTGIPLVDQHPLCEQDGKAGPGCWLSPIQRLSLITTIGHLGASTFDNYRDAIQDARIDDLMASDGETNMLVEALFGAGMGLFGGAALQTLMTMKALGPEAPGILEVMQGVEPSRITSLLDSVPESSVAAVLAVPIALIKASASKTFKGDGADKRNKASFLQYVRAGFKAANDSLMTTMPTVADDVTLAAVAVSLSDTESNSVASFAARIADMLTRFGQQHIAQAGQQLGGGSQMRVARLRVGHASRLAMLRSQPANVMEPGATDWYFENFIDSEFSELAQAYDAANSGDSTLDIDVSEGRAGIKLSAGAPWTDYGDDHYIVPNQNLDTWIAHAKHAQELT